MELGFIGLGKMGLNMVTRLLSGGHDVVVYNRSRPQVKKAIKLGAVGARSIKELARRLKPPRAVWLMVPAGGAVDTVIDKLIPALSRGDCIIDGGNSYYRDSARRAEELYSKGGISFLDAGTSGGVLGHKKGYCLMVGGEVLAYRRLEPVFRTLAPVEGYARVGPSGSGHFVKMVHNGIEYGMLQAYAEGFSLLNASGYGLDMEKISRLWNRGSVIRSWLLELCESVFSDDPGLDGVRAYVEDSGEGRWTVIDSIEKGVACPAITLSLLYRLGSREENPFASRLVAALRREFGGHRVKK